MFNSLVYTTAVRPLFKENSKLVTKADIQGGCEEQTLISAAGGSGLRTGAGRLEQLHGLHAPLEFAQP